MTDNMMINAMNQATKSMWQSQANVNVNVGNGNSLMNLSGASIDVNTGCGAQNITSFSFGTTDITTGSCGKDIINATSIGDANIFTFDSDDRISLITNGNFNVDAGVLVTASSDDDYVNIKSGATNDVLNTVGLGVGMDKAIIVANNVDLTKNAGEMWMGSIGNNYTINTEAAENFIGGYGNNYQFNLGANKSADDIRSLDYWVEDGYNGKHILKDLNLIDNIDKLTAKDVVNLKDVTQVLDKDGKTVMNLTEYDAKYNASQVDFFKTELGDLLYSATNIGNYEVAREFKEIKTEDNRAEIAKQYGLDEKNTELLLGLTDAQMNQKLSDGSAVYAIAKSVKTKNPDGSDRYVLVKRDGTNHSRSVESNECIAFYKSEASTDSVNVINEEMQYDMVTSFTNASMLGNLQNWTISDQKGGASNNSGNLNFIASVAQGAFSITKDADKTGSGAVYNLTNYVGGHISADAISKSIEKTPIRDINTIFTMLISNGHTWTSPLVLDMNGDGVVSAAAGYGIDVNNDGKADGAATAGDKMLAMSDMNGNGKIDGNEVFGDQTVSPFTGKKLNAANGFEALKMIAEEAEQYTGIKCLNDGNVDVKELAKALEKAGVQLGFVSDNNNDKLEALAGVATINVGSYKEVDAKGDVQHRQLGSFTTENGETRKVNDVWFKS